jgi:hypothetical protein
MALRNSGGRERKESCDTDVDDFDLVVEDRESCGCCCS